MGVFVFLRTKSASARLATYKLERFWRDKGNTVSRFLENWCWLIVERRLTFASRWAIKLDDAILE